MRCHFWETVAKYLIILVVLGTSTDAFCSATSMPLSCSELLNKLSGLFRRSEVPLTDFEQAWVLGRMGRFDESEAIVRGIRDRISRLPIKKVLEGKYGSHGAYRAELADGTEVLVKPQSEDMYSSVRKEVGISVYTDLLGFPLFQLLNGERTPGRESWSPCTCGCMARTGRHSGQI